MKKVLLSFILLVASLSANAISVFDYPYSWLTYWDVKDTLELDVLNLPVYPFQYDPLIVSNSLSTIETKLAATPNVGNHTYPRSRTICYAKDVNYSGFVCVKVLSAKTWPSTVAIPVECNMVNGKPGFSHKTAWNEDPTVGGKLIDIAINDYLAYADTYQGNLIAQGAVVPVLTGAKGYFDGSKTLLVSGDQVLSKPTSTQPGYLSLAEINNYLSWNAPIISGVRIATKTVNNQTGKYLSVWPKTWQWIPKNEDAYLPRFYPNQLNAFVCLKDFVSAAPIMW